VIEQLGDRDMDFRSWVWVMWIWGEMEAWVRPNRRVQPADGDGRRVRAVDGG